MTDHRPNWNPRVVEGEIGYLAERIAGALISPNEADRNLEPANVVDGLFAIARAIDRLADAIRPRPWTWTPTSRLPPMSPPRT